MCNSSSTPLSNTSTHLSSIVQKESKMNKKLKFKVYGTYGCGKCGQLQLRLTKKYGRESVIYICDNEQTLRFVEKNSLDTNVPKTIVYEDDQCQGILEFDEVVQKYL